MPESSEEQTNNMRVMFPFEYCKLDRAARLLHCEVGDLIHLGKILAIEILFDTGAIKLNEFVLYPKPQITEEERQEEEEYNIKWRVDRITPYTFYHENINEGYFVVQGLWPISIDTIHILEKDNEIDKKSISISAVDKGHLVENDMAIFFSLSNAEPCAGQDYGFISNSDLEKGADLFSKVSINDFLIGSSDLKKIHSAILSGESLPNMYNDSDIAKQAKKSEMKEQRLSIPHHSAERFASYREEILAAAIYVKHNFPNLCGTSNAEWARAIDTKSSLFWPELGEPPVEIKKIELILGSAVNEGLPHKKQ